MRSETTRLLLMLFCLLLVPPALAGDAAAPEVEQLRDFRDRVLLRRFDRVILVAQAMRRQFPAWWVSDREVCVLHNALMIESYGRDFLNQPRRAVDPQRELGRGGMGAVYKARQTNLGRLVALKVLPKDRMQNLTAVSRFEREMKAVGRLSHPKPAARSVARPAPPTPHL